MLPTIEATVPPVSMISRTARAALLAAGILLSPGAMADWYFGLKAGAMMIDQGGFDDPINAGVTIGREWGVGVGDLGLEAEFTESIDSGSFAGNDVDVSTQAIYGAFRSAGPIYLIAKAGLVREEVEIGSASDSDTGSSFGLGLGFSLGVARFELEYTRIDDDIDFLSLGLRF